MYVISLCFCTSGAGACRAGCQSPAKSPRGWETEAAGESSSGWSQHLHPYLQPAAGQQTVRECRENIGLVFSCHFLCFVLLWEFLLLQPSKKCWISAGARGRSVSACCSLLIFLMEHLSLAQTQNVLNKLFSPNGSLQDTLVVQNTHTKLLCQVHYPSFIHSSPVTALSWSSLW